MIRDVEKNFKNIYGIIFTYKRLLIFTEISCIFIKKQLPLIKLREIRKKRKKTLYSKYVIINLYEIIIFYRYS